MKRIAKSGLYVVRDRAKITMDGMARAPDVNVPRSSTACIASGLVNTLKERIIKNILAAFTRCTCGR